MSTDVKKNKGTTKNRKTKIEGENNGTIGQTITAIRTVMHLPSGGKPPATDDEGLRMFQGSKFGKVSVSDVVNLLPLAFAWDKFCQKINHLAIN